jgi:hypothetical protein
MPAAWRNGKKNVTAISENRMALLLDRVVDIFRRRRIPYALIGAWALAAWGRPRTTSDLDFLVLAKEEDLNGLGNWFSRAGLEPDEKWLQWNPMLKGFQLRFQSREIAVDILRPRDAHDRQVFRRRQRKRIEGHFYWFVSPEDYILQKLKLGRARDFEDALSVLERSGKTLNKGYLHRWARRIGISAELEYILSL